MGETTASPIDYKMEYEKLSEKYKETLIKLGVTESQLKVIEIVVTNIDAVRDLAAILTKLDEMYAIIKRHEMSKPTP